MHQPSTEKNRAANPPSANENATAKPRRLLPVLVPVIVFLGLAGLFGIALQKGDPSKLPSALIGKPAPAMKLAPVPGLTAVDGKPMPTFDTADLASGKPAIVNFWASWCIPCVEEHPYLTALAKRTGVALYGVNHKDEPANARQFLARHGNPFTAIGSDRNGRASIEWGVYGMPETFIVDGKGRIVLKHVGPIGQEAIDKQFMPALKKAGLGG